jgi:anti-anti-sigma factor
MTQCLVKVSGCVTIGQGDVFIQEQVCQALQSKAPVILLDMTDVIYIDSASVQSVAACCTLAEKQGAKVAIIGLRPKVRASYQRLAYLDPSSEFASIKQAQTAIESSMAA